MMTPPTFPMRPMNGGNLESKFATLPPWARAYEPKVNGWRVIVHSPSGACFNRHNEPLTIAGEFKAALAILKDSPFTWLDCEGLSRRHHLGKGSLVVLDIIDLHWNSWAQRKRVIVDYFKLAIIDPRIIQDNWVYHLPTIEAEKANGVWQSLQAQNESVNLTGENVFWEGLVCKRLDSAYTLQLQDSKRETTNWIKHRFI